eukprot:1927646-Pyramimonas_sp.AAC.1
MVNKIIKQSLGPSGRLPAGCLEELLMHPPLGLADLGINATAMPIPERTWIKLQAWHGLPVGGRAAPLPL